MPLPLPQLDDLTYAELVELARSQIPQECPTWTDHNATDPGIVLIELFAWLVEASLYQVDQIPDRTIETFLRLLNGGEFERGSDLQDSIQKTIVDLRQPYRAVTLKDYQNLILQDWNSIQRVHCVPNRNLDGSDINTPAPGHISVIVLPTIATLPSHPTEPTPPEPSLKQKTGIWNYLEARRLLTTRPHVVSPRYVPVQLTADLHLQEGANPTHVLTTAIHNIAAFFHPINSGEYWSGKGWQFGRSVYLSEVYQLLDQLPGVDYVGNVLLNQTQAEVTIAPDQLVAIAIDSTGLIIHERSGGSEKQFTVPQNWRLQHCFFNRGDSWQLWQPTLNLL